MRRPALPGAVRRLGLSLCHAREHLQGPFMSEQREHCIKARSAHGWAHGAGTCRQAGERRDHPIMGPTPTLHGGTSLRPAQPSEALQRPSSKAAWPAAQRAGGGGACLQGLAWGGQLRRAFRRHLTASGILTHDVVRGARGRACGGRFDELPMLSTRDPSVGGSANASG